MNYSGALLAAVILLGSLPLTGRGQITLRREPIGRIELQGTSRVRQVEESSGLLLIARDSGQVDTTSLQGTRASKAFNATSRSDGVPGAVKLIRVHKDTVAVLLDGDFSLTAFTGKGIYRSAFPRANDIHLVTTGDTRPAVDARGRLILASRPIGNPSTAVDSLWLLAVDRSTRRTEVIAAIPSRPVSVTTIDRSGTRPTVRVIKYPFPVESQWAVLSTGSIIVVDGSKCQVNLHAGQVTISEELRPCRRRYLTQFEKDRIRNEQIDSIGQSLTGHRSLLTTIRVAATDSVPSYQSLYQTAFSLPDVHGRFWAAYKDNSSLQYSVIASDAKVYTEVTVPSSCAIAGFGVETLYLSCVTGGRLTIDRIRLRQTGMP